MRSNVSAVLSNGSAVLSSASAMLGHASAVLSNATTMLGNAERCKAILNNDITPILGYISKRKNVHGK